LAGAAGSRLAISLSIRRALASGGRFSTSDSRSKVGIAIRFSNFRI
jgi:hypothetical protein